MEFLASKGYVIAQSVEEKLSAAWDRMEKQSKNFAQKEKYRFYDSEKYKPLIRNGLPFSRRQAMWRRLTDTESAKVRGVITFETVWKRTFHWPSLDIGSCLGGNGGGGDGLSSHFGGAVESGEHGDDETAVSFSPMYPPWFGLDPHLVSRIPHLFHLTARGEQVLHLVLAMIAEVNPDITVAPLLPAFIATLCGQLTPQETFDAAFGLLYLSRERNRVETRLMYFKLNQLEHEAMVRSAVHFIRGKAPEVLRKFENFKIDIFAIINRLCCTFFIDVLPYCIMLRLVDCFVNEGHKVLYRALIALFIDILGKHIHEAVSKDEIEELFNGTLAETLPPPKMAKLFEKAFYYSLSRDVVKDVERRHSNPDRPLLQLRRYESSGLHKSPRLEIRHRPEVYPGDGGGVLQSPQEWEHVFSFFASPLQLNPFLPKRVERIYNTAFNGWSLRSMYGVMEDILRPLSPTKHGVRGLLLIRGVITDGEPHTGTAERQHASSTKRSEGTDEDDEEGQHRHRVEPFVSGTIETTIGAVLHPLPRGQQEGRRYGGGNGTFVFQLYRGEGGGGSEVYYAATPAQVFQQKQEDEEEAQAEAEKQKRESSGEGSSSLTYSGPSAASGGCGSKEGEGGGQKKEVQEGRAVLMTEHSTRFRDRMETEDRTEIDAPATVSVECSDDDIYIEDEVEEGVASSPARSVHHRESISEECSPLGPTSPPPPLQSPPIPQSRNSKENAKEHPSEEHHDGEVDWHVEDELPPHSLEESQPSLGPMTSSSVYTPTSPSKRTLNKYFIQTGSEFLCVGGGSVGGPAIRLSEDLHTAYSYDCSTFQSPSFTTNAIVHSGCSLAVQGGTCAAGANSASHMMLQLDVTGVELYAVLES